MKYLFEVGKKKFEECRKSLKGWAKLACAQVIVSQKIIEVRIPAAPQLFFNALFLITLISTQFYRRLYP
jgi:hypothetical protein